MPKSEEHRRKLSLAMRGRVFSEEHRRKLSNAKRGRTLCVDCHMTTDTWGRPNKEDF